MSFVFAALDQVEGAAHSLAGINSSLAEAASSVAGPTTGIMSAAQDEVSVAIARMFGTVGEEFQALSVQAQQFHAQFVNLMGAGANAYLSAEVSNAGSALMGSSNSGAGQFLGGLGQSLSGAATSAEASIGHLTGPLGASVNSAVSAIRSGGAAAFMGGQIQADVSAISNAVVNAPATLANGIQTGMQGFSTSLSNAGAALTALQTGGAPALANSLNSFAATVAAPYQALMTNTAANLQSISNTIMANPLPVLHQLVNNQVFYGQQIASAIQHLPTELSNLPASLQAAFQGLHNVNPAAFLQGVVNNQIGYAQTVAHALTSAPGDFVTGLQGLPSALNTGFQQIAAGNWTGGVTTIGTGLEHLFIQGFAPLELLGTPEFLPVNVLGSLGDLLPVLSIPGQMVQNVANLLPAGSIPGMMAQNFAHVLQALTSTTATFDQFSFAINFPLPLQLIFDGIGAPATTLMAFGSSATTFANALGAGNATGAVAALLDAPAVLANGFLNGSTLLPLPPLELILGGSATQTGASVVLGGLLTPLGHVVGSLDGFPLTLPGSTTGGIIPGLLSIGSQLAHTFELPAPILPF